MSDELKVAIDGRPPNCVYSWIPYEQRDDGWYIGDNDTPFADPSASERTVRQLIRKEYDVRY